ncbi:MAG TPA: cyclase family protein [Gemmatimonadales bacterium]|jgi:arylformamidase|nr:cyclase family protein [Gemmatimonadales bacterium]
MLYDISPLIGRSLAVWPGDTPLAREVLLDIANGHNITLSTLRATVHLGAHADAPSHYGAGAPDIASVPVERYIGPCEVMRVAVEPGGLIRPAMLPRSVSAPRLLLATGSYPDPGVFNHDFAALTPELVDHLHAAGVSLVGIDTPSLDPFASKDLAAHQRCLAHDMAILEGLVLRDVPEGRYELIALPLRLLGFDASPVRAVLRSSR